MNELLHSLGSKTEAIEFDLFGVPGRVVVVAMVELGAPVVGSAEIDLLYPSFCSETYRSWLSCCL